MRSERVAGALCTWAAYDIYRRWNGPTQVISRHVRSYMRLASLLEYPPSQQQKSSTLLQAHSARSDAEESTTDRGEPQGAFLPGLQAFQQGGSGWYTTTITVNHGDQQGAVTLHDLFGPAGHLDLEHGDLRDFLVHMQQLQGLAGSHRGHHALDRIAQAGPQDFTEVSCRCTDAVLVMSPLYKAYCPSRTDFHYCTRPWSYCQVLACMRGLEHPPADAVWILLEQCLGWLLHLQHRRGCVLPSAATALQADYEMLSALDEGTWQHRPISETQVASLPTHQHISSKKVLSIPLPASHSTGLQKFARCTACNQWWRREVIDGAKSQGLEDAGEEEHQCSICLEAFQDKEVVKTLPCLHHFHAGCIEEWLRREGQKVSCPVCKTPVFEGQA